MTKLFQRYLNLLGIPREKPSLDALSRVVHAQMTTVPFENVSKLYYLRTEGRRDVPDFERFLDGIEHFHFGGTCYACAAYLHRLLVELGYDVDLCGADMQNPDVHLVNIVRIDRREFLVDAGYGAPFLTPLPRDLSADYTIEMGADRYVLSPMDETRRSRLTQYNDTILRHEYTVNPRPRQFNEFAKVVADSFRPDATFMNALLIVRFGDNLSRVLRNRSYTELNGSIVRVRNLDSVEEIVAVIEQRFGIPAEIARIALDGLPL